MNGQSRAISIERRIGQIRTPCNSVPDATTIAVVCSGSSTCSQIADAASAKANPAPPAAKAPRNAPIHTTSRVASEKSALIAS
jgi:hypothetical protein